MKTSKFLTALMLPAMFAACTAEDIVTTNNVAQSERPMLSKDFRLISEGEGEGVNSRFYMAGTSSLSTVWEDGDKYGAALIDQYKPGALPENWDIIYSLAGNVPFIYDAATEEWEAVASTGVGHYLFSFPYNVKDQNRAAVSWELPAIQNLYQDENGEVDLNATINKSNKSVAAALLLENATSHSIKMRNLFSYPKFVIKFDNGLPISTISQVVLEKADGTNFMVKGGFDHKLVSGLFDAKKIADAIKASATDEIKDEDSYWATKQTADFIISDGKTTNDEGDEVYSSEAANFTEFEYSKYIVAKLPNNTKVKLDSDNNKCVEVRFMIPGSLLTDYVSPASTTSSTPLYANNYNMYIYTNNGVYTIENVADYIDFKDTTPAETRKRVFARNASYTLNLTKDAPKKSAQELYIVTDVEDWNGLVNKYGASTAYAGEDALNVAVLGENFTLNADAKMPTKADFKVTTDITIDGTVALQNVFVGEGCKVIVKKDATLNIVDNSNDIKVVENNGTLNFKKYAESRAEVIKKIKTIGTVENMPNAILNVEEDAEVEFTLNNNINYINGILATLDHGQVTNNGVLTLKGGKNVGEFVNNGYIIVTGAFTNEAELILDATKCEEDHADCEHFTPSMTNNKSFVANGAEFKNKGEFVNAATGNVSCSGGEAGKFTNEGYLKATKNGTLLVTTNASTGIIELDEINQAKWSLEAANAGTVLYYAKSTDTSLNFAASAVTKLVIGDQNMAITATGELNKVEMGEGTLTLPKYVATSVNATTGNNDTQLAGTLTLMGGDVVIASELAQITKLVVKENASLTINKNNKVYAGTTENWGAVLVAGAFETASTEDEATKENEDEEIKGIFNSTQGTSGNIVFAVEHAALQTAFDTALENLVTAFADNGVQYNTWVAKGLNSWSGVTYANLFATGTYSVNWGSQTAWVKTAAEALIDAYNALEKAKNSEFVDKAKDTEANRKASVEAILTAVTETAVNAQITAAKATAKTALTSAISTAITNKQLNASWNTVGYAYTGVATDLNAMWTAYGNELLAEMNTWTVANATTGLPEAKYAVDGKLKGSYEFTIKAEILDKVGDATSISITTPVGAYVNADYQTANKTTASEAIYNAVKAYITYKVFTSDVSGIVNYDNNVTLDALQTWCFKLNQTKDEEFNNVASYNAKQAIKDYASTIIGLTETAEYSNKNLDALAALIKYSQVKTVNDLKSAISKGVPVIELSGEIELTEQINVTADVVIKGGTLTGNNIVNIIPNGCNVTIDGVTFKNTVDQNRKSSLHLGYADYGVTGDITVKNCLFEGFGYDAIQISKVSQGTVVTIDNNTFIAPTTVHGNLGTNANGGSYLHISNSKGQLIIKNNKFDKTDQFVDSAVKLNGVTKFSYVTVQNNKFADSEATIIKADDPQIIICKGHDDEAAKNYAYKAAYDAFTSTTAVTLAD